MQTVDRREGTPNEPSVLERVFKFQHEGFRRYMGMQDVTTKNPQKLLAVAAEMARSDHPVVRSSAGWAAQEFAIHRNRNGGVLHLPDRLSALQIADSLWSESEEPFQRLIDQSSPKDAAELFGLNLRARQARAYLPAMELAARWYSGDNVSDDEVQKIRKQTRERTLALGAEVVNLSDRDTFFNNMRAGMCSEILVGALINEDPYSRYLISPASIRQDHDLTDTSRTDLVAIHTAGVHRRISVQISANEKIPILETRRVIIRGKDFLLGGYSRGLLTRLIQRDEGRLERSGDVRSVEEDLAWLRIIPITLADQLDEFEKRRNPEG